ncbi:patatin-like phospholipase family protein [Chitinophagaceae bacterium LB-8]|uniref:Patatin-like phospholipase family protein n=1 Tax=Paraflavisolibacter caeni TaxID=2982496 RepID=A0A9X3BIA5_9BACT|nr:patatin-like phospholipase family protein [Paraflavisolibacter caeni]MCU7551017.1 patatin-like phospholipase family protein [Paraflavisolibacter caeni]
MLLFWVIMFSVVNSSFMDDFGADALYLAPEYLGNVNPLSAAIMGIAVGIFIMCWNITTFILFSRHVNFLAATQYPFVKYCINNSIIPITFLIFYLVKAYQFLHFKELIPNVEIIFLIGGFIAGLGFILVISFLYFFSADKTILRKLQPLFNNAKDYILQLQPETNTNTRTLIHAEWFLTSFYSIRRCRDVSHYSHKIMDAIFKRHHFAAVVSILFAMMFLILIGFFIDHKAFQIPAGASITLLFGIMIGISGAIAYFFQSWSMPFLVVFFVALNYMYQIGWIDPRNKAYGLDYNNEHNWPEYGEHCLNAMSSPENVEKDKQNMIKILNKWKAKQNDTAKPLMILIATSGGGNRSATFTMNMLQGLDSISNGELFCKTFLITGASGGMIGAAYFRELYRQKLLGQPINLQDDRYVDAISEDLLNPTFSSFVARDIFSPAQYFHVGPYRYIKDRGYSFELKLNSNTNKILNHRLKDYIEDESNAVIPLMFFHSVISRDAKKLIISTQPVRFMMSPPVDSSVTSSISPDAVDFVSFFSRQNPYNLRMLTILRTNATFPIVMPSVWLPSKPVVDVMDGGLRDNFGMENCLRFISSMKEWIKQNTRGVLILQIRDRQAGGWEMPYEIKGFGDHTVKPVLLLQHSWSKMMEYFQNDMYTYFASNTSFPVYKVVFQYTSANKNNQAALSFHLTEQEKRDIKAALTSKINSSGMKKVQGLMK